MSTIALPLPAAALPVVARPSFTPRPLLWTVADFHRVGETGVFDNRRPVLIRGLILEQGMMNPPHALGVELVTEALRVAFGSRWRFRGQLPLVLGLDTDPMPDVAVIAGGVRDQGSVHPTMAVLVVEISDTTLALDLTEKAELYATAGVPDYWVLDLAGRRLLVLRDPAPIAAGGSAYRTQQTLGPTESITPSGAPNATIKVSDLLP